MRGVACVVACVRALLLSSSFGLLLLPRTSGNYHITMLGMIAR